MLDATPESVTSLYAALRARGLALVENWHLWGIQGAFNQKKREKMPFAPSQIPIMDRMDG
jgi:hypothetical protein